MIYIHAAGIHNLLPEKEAPDLKAELRALGGNVYRRTDRFIQLAIIGAHKAISGAKLEPETALYMTSGQGDIPVFERVRRQRYFQKMMSKPVDFVNMTSNTAGFYVASHIGLEGSNLFLTHQRFPVQMALLLAQSDLGLQKHPAILLGGVDEWLENQELAKKMLGIKAGIRLGEGSNWMLLKDEPEGALATLSVDYEMLDFSQLKKVIEMVEPGTWLAFSGRLPMIVIDKVMALRRELKRFSYEHACAYYETLPLYVLNRFVTQERGKLLHIDGDGERCLVMQLETFS
ncbi:hypothetical protein KAI46_16355 [bacterium]|nr:hypothetical protein [bacterium]